MNSKHFIGIHGYMIVYSVGSKQSFEMVNIVRDKILNHLVSLMQLGIDVYWTFESFSANKQSPKRVLIGFR